MLSGPSQGECMARSVFTLPAAAASIKHSPCSGQKPGAVRWSQGEQQRSLLGGIRGLISHRVPGKLGQLLLALSPADGCFPEAYGHFPLCFRVGGSVQGFGMWFRVSRHLHSIHGLTPTK